MTAPLACNAFQHPISQHLDGAPESHSTSSLANILSVFAISHLTHRDAHPDGRSVRIANGDAFSQNFSPRDFSLVGVPHNTGSANLIASKRLPPKRSYTYTSYARFHLIWHLHGSCVPGSIILPTLSALSVHDQLLKHLQRSFTSSYAFTNGD